MGRPALPPENRRTHFVNVRFTRAEYERVIAALATVNEGGNGPRVSPGSLIRQMVIHELDLKDKRRKAADAAVASFAKRGRSVDRIL